MYSISEVLNIIKDHFDGSNPTILEKEDEKSIKPEEIVNNTFDDHFKDPEVDILSYSQIGIIINDIDRPTPSYLILEKLLEKFEGLEDKINSVHIATGSHRMMEPEETGHSRFSGLLKLGLNLDKIAWHLN